MLYVSNYQKNLPGCLVYSLDTFKSRLDNFPTDFLQFNKKLLS